MLVSADKRIAAVRVISAMGSTVAQRHSSASQVAVATDACTAGIYVVEIIYADGSRENLKVALNR